MSGQFEVVSLRNGTQAIRHLSSGEIMHPSVGPWAEANGLYILQGQLKQRLTQTSGGPLRVYDIGLGAGANAAAALSCASGLGDKQVRPLELVSFEMDLGAAVLALHQPEAFPFLIPWRAAFERLLDTGTYQCQGIRWSLLRGSALDQLPFAPAPAHLVFFDFFSPKVNPVLWTSAAFGLVRANCGNGKDSEGSLLVTYSASTAVRVNILLAGFYVGTGMQTGGKLETTVASTHLEMLGAPLDARWLERLRRSSAPLPPGFSSRQELEKRICAHPQFQAR